MAQPTLSGVLVFYLSFLKVQQLLPVVGQSGNVTHLLISIILISTVPGFSTNGFDGRKRAGFYRGL